jgi:hypothetical protein
MSRWYSPGYSPQIWACEVVELANSEDLLYEKWKTWLNQITDETHTLFVYRDYWRGLAEMTKANDDIPPSTIFDALGVWYGTTQATSIRRQLDDDRRSISFRNLLTDIAAHPEVLTRERHLRLWDGDPRDWARELGRKQGNANFDGFAGKGNDQIDPALTKDDLDRLLSIGEPVKKFVNKAVAHTDEKALGGTSTYTELNAAIDQLGDLLTKYSSLLTATIVSALLEPVHVDDWRQAFRVVWWKE